MRLELLGSLHRVGDIVSWVGKRLPIIGDEVGAWSEIREYKKIYPDCDERQVEMKALENPKGFAMLVADDTTKGSFLVKKLQNRGVLGKDDIVEFTDYKRRTGYKEL